MLKRILMLPVLLVPWVGCGGGESAKTPSCEAIVGCGSQSVSECNDLFSTMVISQACEDAIVAAPCAEHEKTEPSYFVTCFPACTGETATCAGSNISMCQKGRAYLFTCIGVCAYKDMTYSGTCGKAYNGQVSSTGQDVCWCIQN